MPRRTIARCWSKQRKHGKHMQATRLGTQAQSLKGTGQHCHPLASVGLTAAALLEKSTRGAKTQQVKGANEEWYTHLRIHRFGPINASESLHPSVNREIPGAARWSVH